MKRFLTIFMAFSICGCAVHPVPENYSGRYTLNIVQSIRCEARDGFKRYLIKLSQDSSDERFADSETKKAFAALDGTGDLSELKRKNLSLGSQKLLKRFDRASIIYDFQFLMTESNNNAVTTAFEDPLTRGLLSVGVVGGTILKRQNQRTFRVVDLFSEFYSAEMQDRCDLKKDLASGRSRKNLGFPITGEIGLSDVIWTYFLLTQTIGLSAAEYKNLNKTPTFIEKLTFTTTLSGEVNPTLQLNPVGRDIHISKVVGMFGSSRIDEHQVTIAIGLNPETGAPASANSVIEELERQQMLDAFQARRGF